MMIICLTPLFLLHDLTNLYQRAFYWATCALSIGITLKTLLCWPQENHHIILLVGMVVIQREYSISAKLKVL